MKPHQFVGGLTAVAVFLLGCAPVEKEPAIVAMKIPLTSPAFAEGQPIPRQYTADGADISPALKWGSVSNAKTLVLICDDPDAPMGTWVHWVLFNLPTATTELPEKIPATASLPNGAKHGRNDFGQLGYGGPAPPGGKAHRYFFKLYALDIELSLPAGASKAEVLRAAQGRVLAEGQLMGTYQRGR